MTTPTQDVLRLGTRTSRLAMWQAEHVAAALKSAWPGLRVELVTFITEGDRSLERPLPEIGGKGLFTAEIEAALLVGRIDLAVHSLKDLPTDDPAGLTLGAITERADPRDAWVCPAGTTLDALPPGAVVGTSSLRRAAQLLRRRPDLTIRSIRGNVETRIGKTRDGAYDATVLACAGLERLGRMDAATAVLDLNVMLPAPGQAALAVQIRAGDESVGLRVAALDHEATRMEVEAERHFLAALGGGCSAPIAALGRVAGGALHLRGRVCSVDGAQAVDVDHSAPLEQGVALAVGRAAAEDALARGARALLT